ncbi:hypothetical protein NE237_025647 [Protea cynaroides]|uniref:Uncharacterized protein n=1 Tax=Protea cynaroides TaxID=273540 RepID=A0A9Q0H2B4_9MAGN|nr:hypothetical protein NE237_025647 [Protea cynaroides]
MIYRTCGGLEQRSRVQTRGGSEEAQEATLMSSSVGNCMGLTNSSSVNLSQNGDSMILEYDADVVRHVPNCRRQKFQRSPSLNPFNSSMDEDECNCIEILEGDCNFSQYRERRMVSLIGLRERSEIWSDYYKIVEQKTVSCASARPTTGRGSERGSSLRS